MIKNTTLFYLFTVGFFSSISAQSLSSSVVASGGGFSSTTSGSLSYTIAEANIATYQQSSAILTQGFQQSNQGAGSSVMLLNSANVSIQLYPNPASTYIEFNIVAPQYNKVSIAIYNILGEKISDVANVNDNGYGHHAVQEISSLSDGVYFGLISITDASGQIQNISKRFTVIN